MSKENRTSTYRGTFDIRTVEGAAAVEELRSRYRGTGYRVALMGRGPRIESAKIAVAEGKLWGVWSQYGTRRCNYAGYLPLRFAVRVDAYVYEV